MVDGAWLLVWALVGPPAPRVQVQADASDATGGIAQQLVRRADGGYEHTNRRAGSTATIHADGRVSVRDHAVGGGSIQLLGFDVTGGTPNVPDPRQPSNTLVRPQDLGSLADDPLVKWGPYGPPPLLLSAGGRMGGLADMAVVSRRADAKQRFLDATDDLRARLAADHRRQAERRALVSLESDLRRQWTAADTPPSVQREQLFQRWDDCAELPHRADASAEQRARARAGEQARRRIEAWIREHVPETGADRFTAAELASMNGRRRSRTRFEPYVARPVPVEPAAQPVGPAAPPVGPAAPPTD